MQLQTELAAGKRWGLFRLILGMLQVSGAVFSITLIYLTGLNSLSLGASVVTGLLTTISILLFGGKSPEPPQGDKGK